METATIILTWILITILCITLLMSTFGFLWLEFGKGLIKSKIKKFLKKNTKSPEMLVEDWIPVKYENLGNREWQVTIYDKDGVKLCSTDSEGTYKIKEKVVTKEEYEKFRKGVE